MRQPIQRAKHASGPAWDVLGVNYGSDVVYGLEADIEQATVDLTAITGRMNRIRFHLPSFNASTAVVDHCLEVIDLAKSMGLKVIWGNTANGTPLTSSNWQEYHDVTVARAIMAQEHGIDEYTVGNEDEYRIDGTTLPIATFRANINQLAADVKAIYSGTVSYTVSHNHTFGWITLGKGNLDKMALNIYGSSPTDHRFYLYILNTFRAAFGNDMYISEINVTDSWANLAMSEAEQKRAWRDRLAHLKRLNIPEVYFFTYAHASDDEFALRLADGTYRSMWDLFAKDRPLISRG